eukprot:TRINITY_DN8781_c0_g1_i4.p1 TRINITY_DN8781_c0_g1~~TRINITY_DN8781_c0_g1_i4.p1  ORF type:complete len:277 (+),score=35.15 TRINITY_DN8781_c0_g1_i4:52-882(+)
MTYIHLMLYLFMFIMLFFFFKQKTAYEMLRSLVGSEMCIRDRCLQVPVVLSPSLACDALHIVPPDLGAATCAPQPIDIMCLSSIKIQPHLRCDHGGRFTVPLHCPRAGRQHPRHSFNVALSHVACRHRIKRHPRHLLQDGLHVAVLVPLVLKAALDSNTQVPGLQAGLCVPDQGIGLDVLQHVVQVFQLIQHRERRAVRMQNRVALGGLRHPDPSPISVNSSQQWSSRDDRPYHHFPERCWGVEHREICLLYTSDAADEEDSVDLGGRRIIKNKKK